MRRMLIDDVEAVLVLRDDIAEIDLPDRRDVHRIKTGFRYVGKRHLCCSSLRLI